MAAEHSSPLPGILDGKGEGTCGFFWCGAKLSLCLTQNLHLTSEKGGEGCGLLYFLRVLPIWRGQLSCFSVLSFRDGKKGRKDREDGETLSLSGASGRLLTLR